MLNTIALLTVLSGGPLAADSVPGTWQIRGSVEGNPIDEVCTLKQAGSTLSGSCSFQGTSFPLTGEVKDGTVTFRHAAGEYEGSALTLAFSGRFPSANELKGTVLVDPFGVAGEFTATRTTAAP